LSVLEIVDVEPNRRSGSLGLAFVDIWATTVDVPRGLRDPERTDRFENNGVLR
jgi:hypothetical protein